MTSNMDADSSSQTSSNSTPTDSPTNPSTASPTGPSSSKSSLEFERYTTLETQLRELAHTIYGDTSYVQVVHLPSHNIFQAGFFGLDGYQHHRIIERSLDAFSSRLQSESHRAALYDFLEPKES